MDIAFKFEVGSFVRMLISHQQIQTDEAVGAWRLSGEYREMRGQVISRMAEECPGGFQNHYTIRWVDSAGNFLKDFFRHNEIELVSSEPFPPVKIYERKSREPKPETAKPDAPKPEAS